MGKYAAREWRNSSVPHLEVYELFLEDGYILEVNRKPQWEFRGWAVYNNKDELIGAGQCNNWKDAMDCCEAFVENHRIQS